MLKTSANKAAGEKEPQAYRHFTLPPPDPAGRANRLPDSIDSARRVFPRAWKTLACN